MAALSASCLSETVMGGMWSETRWMALSLQQQKTRPFSICTATLDSVIWEACTCSHWSARWALSGARNPQGYHGQTSVWQLAGTGTPMGIRVESRT